MISHENIWDKKFIIIIEGFAADFNIFILIIILTQKTL